jgi:hypothetical protein
VANAATTTVSIVFETAADPVQLGLQVTRVDPAGFLKVSALGIEKQGVRVTICDGGVPDAPAAARRD